MRFIVTEKGQILRMQMKEEQRIMNKNQGFQDMRIIVNREGASLSAKDNRNSVFGSWSQKRTKTSNRRNLSQEPFERQEVYELPINLMSQIDEISSLKAQKENKNEQSNIANSNFENHNAAGIKKSSSMPFINRISKMNSKAFNIKKASAVDIISTIDSPSHWRYYSRKEEKKKEFINTLKVGPFLAGNTHTGFGNTVAISWAKRKQQKSILDKVDIDDEDLYKTMRKIIFNNEENISSQQVLGRQHEQEIERIKILKNIKKKSLILHQKNSMHILKPTIPNEEEFLKKLNSVNSIKERSKVRLLALHSSRYVHQWKHPRIVRITRSKEYHPI